jgi:hypothetical protein
MLKFMRTGKQNGNCQELKAREVIYLMHTELQFGKIKVLETGSSDGCTL